MNKPTPPWLQQAWILYGKEIAADELGWRSIVRRYGLTKYKSIELAKFVKKNGSPDSPKCPCGKSGCERCDAPETPVDDIEEREIVAENEHNWLFEDAFVYNGETDTYITFLSAAPKPIIVPGSKHRSMRRSYSNWDGRPSSINEITRQFNIPRDWFIEYKSKHGWTHDSDPFTNEEVENKTVEELVSDALLMKRAHLHQEYEKAKWKETRDKAEKWDKFQDTVMGPLIDAIEDRIPAYQVPLISIPRKWEKTFSVVISPTDFHWGSYGWVDETGETYNREEAKRRLITRTEDIITRLPGNPEKIYVSAGGDWFHVDGDKPTTSRGTLMDGVDGSPSEIFMTGCEMAVMHIDMLRQVAPVEVIMMQGNHDAANSLSVLMYLHAWYRTCDDVVVHKSPKHRQYTTYGNTLMGFTHGDGAKHKDLGALMAVEARTEWGKTENRAWFTGHLHHEVVKEMDGVTIYQMPSLAGTDRWHAKHGWTTSRSALAAYIIDVKDGVVGNIMSPV